MKVSQMFPSKYVKADDLSGRRLTLTIQRVTVEEMGQDREKKMVVWFHKATKGLVLNKSNAMTIAGLYGDDTDGWLGQAITIYPDRVRAFGETHNVVRVADRVAEPKEEREKVTVTDVYQTAPPAPPPLPKEEEVDDWDTLTIGKLQAVVALSESNDNLFYENESLTYLREAMTEADRDSGENYMPTKPAEGKKVSMYAFLCMKIDELLGKGAHGPILSYLLRRIVTKGTPPGINCRFLLDDLMTDRIYVEDLTDLWALIEEEALT